MNVFVPPRWEKPSPLGYGEALDTVSGVAAPLLAGFSLSGVIAVGQAPNAFRWPDAAMAGLAAAAVLLILCVQCGFTARRYLYSAEDVRAWWPDIQADSDRESKLEAQQKVDFRRWSRWAAAAAAGYNLGLLAFLLGAALVMAPPTSNPGTSARWAGVALALAAATAELIWIALSGLDLLRRAI